MDTNPLMAATPIKVLSLSSAPDWPDDFYHQNLVEAALHLTGLGLGNTLTYWTQWSSGNSLWMYPDGRSHFVDLEKIP